MFRIKLPSGVVIEAETAADAVSLLKAMVSAGLEQGGLYVTAKKDGLTPALHPQAVRRFTAFQTTIRELLRADGPWTTEDVFHHVQTTMPGAKYTSVKQLLHQGQVTGEFRRVSPGVWTRGPGFDAEQERRRKDGVVEAVGKIMADGTARSPKEVLAVLRADGVPCACTTVHNVLARTYVREKRGVYRLAGFSGPEGPTQ